MFFQNSFHYGLLCNRLSWLWVLRSFSFEVINVKTQYIFVVYGMGYRVGVQPLLENVFRSFVRSFFAFPYLICRVFIKYGSTGKSKELSIREKLLYRFVIVTKL